MAGSGSAADLRRPLYAPLRVAADDIIAYTYELSDYGQYALAGFVARRRSAFGPLWNERRCGLSKKARLKRDTIEVEFRKWKKNFDLRRLRVAAR